MGPDEAIAELQKQQDYCFEGIEELKGKLKRTTDCLTHRQLVEAEEDLVLFARGLADWTEALLEWLRLHQSR